jgi:NADH-quinone oxidoreductase subunit N
LAGFFGKFYLFSVALRSGGNQALFWLVVLGLLGSFVSLYYYLLVLKAIFVDEPGVPRERPLDRVPSGSLQQATVTLIASVVVVLGIMPSVLATRILAAIP